MGPLCIGTLLKISVTGLDGVAVLVGHGLIGGAVLLVAITLHEGNVTTGRTVVLTRAVVVGLELAVTLLLIVTA